MVRIIGQNVLCVAIICLTILECWALHLGHNGLILSLSVGAICAIAGVNMDKTEIMRSVRLLLKEHKQELVE